MVRWQTQLSTGRRVERLSDDSPQAGLLLKQRSIKAAIGQYDKNLRVAKDYLGSSEVALTEIQGILKKGYETALSGANSTMDQPARVTLADQVAQAQQRLLQLANSRGADQQYLFAGQATDAPPYSVSGNTLVYNGDANPIRVETGAGETMKVNISGGQDFVDAYNALESLRTNLLSGNTGALSGIDVDVLKRQGDRFSQLRSEAGTVMQQVKELESMNLRRMDQLTEGISNIEDVDFADAVANLSQAQTAYQAALQVTANASRLSLMDYLR
jgi:flagellar hook-associated protein 3 FlgL